MLDRALASFVCFAGDGKRHANIEAIQMARDVLASPVSADPIAVPRAPVVSFVGGLDDAPADASGVYLRLHLLSARKVQPHGQNLAGIFGLLNNVVWTDIGPYDPDTFDRVSMRARSHGRALRVSGVDKFPRMTDNVIPSGVRIADADRVRLGAHLASGTTVMHEGFCNFNAGTLGVSMVEGRISAGVVVGRVERIAFDDKAFQARVDMAMDERFAFPKDSSLKILTSGLLGEQYIGIEAGAEADNLKAGDKVQATQSAVVLENLISQFLYSKASEPTPAAK
jgi:hypothetical protein